MVELHSNFTFEGSKTPQDGMLPTNHQLHESIEIDGDACKTQPRRNSRMQTG
jgi:hypothetical protein